MQGVVKIIELIGESPHGWEAAIKQVMAEAQKTWRSHAAYEAVSRRRHGYAEGGKPRLDAATVHPEISIPKSIPSRPGNLSASLSVGTAVQHLTIARYHVECYTHRT
jgi:flavin-binding protein dodecin